MSTIGPYAPSTTFVSDLLTLQSHPSTAQVVDPDSIFSMAARSANVEKTILYTLLQGSTLFLVEGSQLPSTVGEWKRCCVPYLISLETLYSSDLNFYQTLDPEVRLRIEIHPVLKIQGKAWKSCRIFRDGLIHYLEK